MELAASIAVVSAAEITNSELSRRLHLSKSSLDKVVSGSGSTRGGVDKAAVCVCVWHSHGRCGMQQHNFFET